MNLMEAGLYSSDPDIAEALYMLDQYTQKARERAAKLAAEATI